MHRTDIEALNSQIERESHFIEKLLAQIRNVIIGQQKMIDQLMVGLLADGHILLEGVPGLAKTTAVKALAEAIQADFHRIQFTPDLLPADLIGTMIYRQKDGDFVVKKGPIFANIVLADEINRAPAKVQSALLEAMQEKQVTIGEHSYPLQAPFLVLATQNPIEQEGTYPLPEAQVDRFMLKLHVDYPNRDEELAILRRMTQPVLPGVEPAVSLDEILRARRTVRTIYMDEKIEHYIVDLVFCTRQPDAYGLSDLERLIEYGASPRASIFLALASRAHAFLNSRGYVTPEDVRAVAMDVLRHRVIVSYEAEAEEATSEDVLQRILSTVEVP